MKSRLRKKPILICTVSLLAPLAVFLVFGERFLWLNTHRIDERADAVIVLAGSLAEDRLRVKAAIGLFQRQKAKYLILPMRNRYFTWTWALKTYQLVGTPPKDRILIGRFGREKAEALERYGGTFVEAQYAAQFMHRYRLRSAVVVSSGYHMRRVAMAFERTGMFDGLTISYHPVDDANSFWWMYKHRSATILREYRKLIAALFLYPSAADPSPNK